MNYYEKAYKASKTEIEEIIQVGFTPVEPFMYMSDSNGDMIRCPSFVVANPEIQALLSDLGNISYTTGPLKELRAQRDDLKEQLKIIYQRCEQIFQGIGYVLTETIEAEYKRIRQSDKKLSVKIERLESLKQTFTDIRYFFGVKENTVTELGGLIFGTPIDDCLSQIHHYSTLITILEKDNIHVGSYLDVDQTTVSLRELTKLQQTAIPKAKEYIQVQVALNKGQKKSSDDGRGKHFKDKEIIPEDDFWLAAQKIYQEKGDKCISSQNSKYPSEWLKKQLAGETSSKKFYGYRRVDEDKKNPVRLKKSKIRSLLGENTDKWKHRK